MKRSKKAIRIVSVTLGAVLVGGALTAFAGCGGGGTPDTLVIMTEDLNGLYNPFYSSAGTDMDVTGQTQISMLSTDSNGDVAYGDNEPTVVKDYKRETSGSGNNVKTTYTFVIKNGLKFSDGTPLTMNDVLFNLYVYLDPAYAGSSTIYSTKIEGLQNYRAQQNVSDSSDQDDVLSQNARYYAGNRQRTLLNIYQQNFATFTGSTSYFATVKDMRDYIQNDWQISSSYKEAIANKFERDKLTDQQVRNQLLADYNYIVGADTVQNGPSDYTFKGDKGKFYEELVTDYNTAKEAYTDEMYKKIGKFNDPVVCFLFYEGFIDPVYGRNAQNEEDRNNIIGIEDTISATIKGSNAQEKMENAIAYVWAANVEGYFHQILSGWSTGSTQYNEFLAQGKDIALRDTLDDENALPIANISGIRSLGHKELNDQNQTVWEYAENTVVIDGTTYTIAKEHNQDGTPVNANENDVLQITVEGTDPKAIWNFGFTVAPYHYYSDPDTYPIDIEHNQFGVAWASYKFQTDVLQGTTSAKFGRVSKNSVPMGAGPYMATDQNGVTDTPTAGGFFFQDSIVNYKANPYFSLDGKTSAEPKIKKMRYQITTAGNAIAQLKSGKVHFVEPQFTPENLTEIKNLKKKGFDYVSTWNLGYGYIGVSAKYVPNVNLRRAIMAAMNIAYALEYYDSTSAANIYWPMSVVSWAYPRRGAQSSTNPTVGLDNQNGKSWTMFTTEADAKTAIEGYMRAANVGKNDPSLKLTFTIAGSSLTEHPCYEVFKHAAELLNDCGWNVQVLPDTNALIKLATGSLAVWAAAWGSTIDPDMYQVYHKNSTATSVLAWGYDAILADSATYSYENRILNDLADKIDEARTILSDDDAGKAARAALYREAMGYVLDLAVELPVYQRQVMFAFNEKVIDVNTFPHDPVTGEILMNSYSSPLSRIWELNFVGATEEEAE